MLFLLFRLQKTLFYRIVIQKGLINRVHLYTAHDEVQVILLVMELKWTTFLYDS